MKLTDNHILNQLHIHGLLSADRIAENIGLTKHFVKNRLCILMHEKKVKEHFNENNRIYSLVLR